MTGESNDGQFTKELILKALIQILEDMTSDWEMEFDGHIGSDTNLIADLEFESIDVVQFIVAIEEHFKRRNLPFEELVMVDGRYVDEIRVGGAVPFLYRHLNNK